MTDTKIVMKRSKTRLKVTFPDGKEFCYKNGIDTMIETLRYIGEEKLRAISWNVGTYPLLVNEIIPRIKNYLKEIIPGWYLNSNGIVDTDSKLLQLKKISDTLNLGLQIEKGDFKTAVTLEKRVKATRPKKKIVVTFEDGTVSKYDSPKDTFIDCLYKIGVDRVAACRNLDLFTTTKTNNYQEQIAEFKWVTTPNSAKKAVDVLVIIKKSLNLNIDIKLI